MRRTKIDAGELDLKERVVSISRITKVVKGGRNFHSSALVAVGDHNGHVGIDTGKALETPETIHKAAQDARKNLVSVSLLDSSIPHEIYGVSGAGEVFLKPVAPGTGVVADGAVRAVCELAGISDIRTKNTGSNNPRNTVNTTMDALTRLKTAEDAARLRGKSVEEILGQEGSSMETIKIKLIRSPIGRTSKHRKAVKVLGLSKVGQVLEKQDTPQVRGMINAIDYVVEIVD